MESWEEALQSTVSTTVRRWLLRIVLELLFAPHARMNVRRLRVPREEVKLPNGVLG